eukprot:CAMPEP_0168397826 /NCGR_PEP_ID=MMETSP0228-20121227/21264_1 /TAXON_ID=133427 /ORGANISM="Protoceratium reticulatum, Strain CCCM 535 (=CCMP 1889)" /LENGTH=270 /DNA_ID=CAMNT_0008411311 /DNA_START=51 /DNA_END=859 /DNA_ORIENTATION=+
MSLKAKAAPSTPRPEAGGKGANLQVHASLVSGPARAVLSQASAGAAQLASAAPPADAVRLHLLAHSVSLLPLHPVLLIKPDPHPADKAGVEVNWVELSITVCVEGAQHLLDLFGSLFGADDPGDVLEVVKRDCARCIVVKELKDVHDIISLVFRAELGRHPFEELIECNLGSAQQDCDVFLHGDAQGHGGALELLGIDETTPVLIYHVKRTLHVVNLVHGDLARDTVCGGIEGAPSTAAGTPAPACSPTVRVHCFPGGCGECTCLSVMRG